MAFARARTIIAFAVPWLVVALGSLVCAPAGAAQPGRIFSDCRDNCPDMVEIPAGDFVMGASIEEETRENVPKRLRGWSFPLRRVAIERPFAIGRFEITRAEFALFVAETGHGVDETCWAPLLEPGTRMWTYASMPGVSWREPGFAQTARDPVVCVNWRDATAYVRWLGRRTGKPYRLPSEAEWEYAARAGSRAARFWGEEAGRACDFANVADLAAASAFAWRRHDDQIFLCNDGHSYTAPVGTYRPNGFGLHDVLGNAWELVEDCWNANHRGHPADAGARLRGDCSVRVVRGGSWDYKYPRYLRTGFRASTPVGRRTALTGFRVARDF